MTRDLFVGIKVSKCGPRLFPTSFCFQVTRLRFLWCLVSLSGRLSTQTHCEPIKNSATSFFNRKVKFATNKWMRNISEQHGTSSWNHAKQYWSGYLENLHKAILRMRLYIRIRTSLNNKTAFPHKKHIQKCSHDFNVGQRKVWNEVSLKQKEALLLDKIAISIILQRLFLRK